MKRSALLLSLFVFAIAGSVSAQQRDQIPREFVNPEELISFDRSTGFQDAIEILSQFSQDFENRFILDRTGTTGPIGVSLPPMHWKDAFNFILRIKNLISIESPDFFEIVTQEEARRQLEPEPDRAARPGPQVRGQELNISTKTREIRINATFFEGNKRALREIGVDWSTFTGNRPDNLGDFVTDQGNETIPETGFSGDRFVSVNSRGAQNVSQNVFNALVDFGDIGSGISVQALFSAFEADNLGQVLATPSVKVMDGEEGRVQVGEDFSIKQRDFAGNVTDEFVSTGTILTIRPQLVQFGDTTLIYLELEAERSSAQPDPVSTIVSKQEARTSSILLDGESTVIAGLFRTERAEVRRGIPILKDLPSWFFGLKYLFGFNSTDVQENELIIIVQAELEETIETRMNRAFRSAGQQLSDRQEENRNYMEYVSPRSPVPPSTEDPSFEAPRAEVSLDDQTFLIEEEEVEEEPIGIVEEPAPEPEIDLRPRMEPRELTQTEIDRLSIEEYAGKWRDVEMNNVNGKFENLNFYVIGGSFLVRDNADRLYRSFRNEGLDAHMLYNPSTEFYFVAYRGFEKPEDAIEYTRHVQQTRQPEAWLSRIITEERMDLNNR